MATRSPRQVPPPNTVVGYVRVSTVEQANEGVSLEAQADRIRAYCAMRGLTLLEVIADKGVSGGRPLASREGGAQVLAAIASGKVSGVVAVKLDRLFRSTPDCLTTIEAWDKTGTALHLIDMGGASFDTQSPTGRLFITMLAGFAEFERGVIGERTRMALAHKRAKGEKLGGDAPYGYDVASGRLVPNATEQRVIERAKAMHGAGTSLRGIAKALAADGLVARNGKPFAPQSLAGILSR